MQFEFSATPLPDTGITSSQLQFSRMPSQRNLHQSREGSGGDRARRHIRGRLDKLTLDFGLQRLERKRNSLRAYADEHSDFVFVEPVMLVAARDTEHADQVAAWLKDKRSLGHEGIMSPIHTGRRLEELGKLVAIDRPGNRIRVVVNVFQLSEGWDVTNVYVVAPLRAMATYQNAVQSMVADFASPQDAASRTQSLTHSTCFASAGKASSGSSMKR